MYSELVERQDTCNVEPFLVLIELRESNKSVLNELSKCQYHLPYEEVLVSNFREELSNGCKYICEVSKWLLHLDWANKA